MKFQNLSVKRLFSLVAVSYTHLLFEAPFWIGLYERTDGGKYEVCKITFGSEPKDYEVYEFLLKNCLLYTSRCV